MKFHIFCLDAFNAQKYFLGYPNYEEVSANPRGIVDPRGPRYSLSPHTTACFNREMRGCKSSFSFMTINQLTI